LCCCRVRACVCVCVRTCASVHAFIINFVGDAPV